MDCAAIPRLRGFIKEIHGLLRHRAEALAGRLVERIAQLVNLALKGVPIRALAVAPRQLPYHQGFAYFELDKSSEIWGTLKKSGGIGFFAGSGFPALKLERWAIRSE